MLKTNCDLRSGDRIAFWARSALSGQMIRRERLIEESDPMVTGPAEPIGSWNLIEVVRDGVRIWPEDSSNG